MNYRITLTLWASISCWSPSSRDGTAPDLFGFYNYLEKRYKATELARALVQFELFNKTNWDLPEEAEIDDRSDRMLLVLLDEMNLARTEYYFSEFLSKLETRRTVDEMKARGPRPC